MKRGSVFKVHLSIRKEDIQTLTVQICIKLQPKISY
jgi:hypothetical protein